MTMRATTNPVRRNGVQRIRFLTASAIVVAGLAIVWTGGRNDVKISMAHNTDPAAMTVGLSREALAESAAIHGARVSGAGSTTAPIESGLSRELLQRELAAIHRK